ncbi:MAG: PAS domain S-box protein [Bacteroidota bacterium]|nr:PAS domain S-box protein [Bacteroidota bacterium]
MKTEISLLLLEDDTYDAELIQKSLRQAELKFRATIVSNKAEFAQAIDDDKFDVILSDNSLPEFNATEAMKFLQDLHIDSPFILVTGKVSEEFAVDIIHKGADDYILKSNLVSLPSSIVRAMESRKAKKEKLKTDSELMASEKRYRSLFQRNLAGIYLSTIEGKIIDCNNSFCKMLGYANPAELRKIPPRNLYCSEMDRTRTMMRLEREEFLFNYEGLLRRKNGDPLYVIENISLINNKETGNRTVEGIVIDITQRRSVEDDLRKSEEKYRLLIDENPLPAWVCDNQTKRFLAVNDAAVKHYGYSHGEFIGIHVNRIQPVIESWGLSGLARHIKKDGTAIDVEIVSTLIAYENKSACLVLVNDLTHKLKAENEIREANRELHELSLHLQNIREEERIQIARDIHDELGQQLTALKMDLHALDKQVRSDDIAIRGKFTDIIVLVEEVVNSVRQIASNLRPNILDDLGLVAALKWQSHEVENRFGIEIRFRCDMQEIEAGKAIGTGLFRIYQEALTNAVRHANAQLIESELRIKNNRLILEIRDNGKGIDAGDQSAIKSFGLLGIKERVFVMDGEYALTSESGKGTCLTISVPF